MSCLRICLSLLCAVAILQSSVSANGAVLVTCSEIEVACGGTCTLNCSVKYQDLESTCEVVGSSWCSTGGNKSCNHEPSYSMQKSNNLTYVSLTVSVTETSNYTVDIYTTCGMDRSSPITVQLRPCDDGSDAQSVQCSKNPIKTLTAASITTIFACVILTVGILYLMFRTRICKKIHEVYQKEKFRSNFNTDIF